MTSKCLSIRPPVMEKPLAAALGSRLAGQAHQSRVAAIRLVAVPRRDLHHARSAARRGGSTIIAAIAAPASISARRRLSRRPIVSMRGAAFPISPSSTKAPFRASCALDRQSHLWLRRLSRGLSVEQIRRRRSRNEACRARGIARAAARRSRAARRRGVPRAVRKEPGQAHRPRPLHPQCADRDRQFGATQVSPPKPSACSTIRRRWCAAPRSGRSAGSTAHGSSAPRRTRRGETDPDVVAEWTAARAHEHNVHAHLLRFRLLRGTFRRGVRAKIRSHRRHRARQRARRDLERL